MNYIEIELKFNLERYGYEISEIQFPNKGKRIYERGEYVNDWWEIIKSPHGESGPRSFKELKNIFEAEEKMRLRSERIEKILGYDN